MLVLVSAVFALAMGTVHTSLDVGAWAKRISSVALSLLFLLQFLVPTCCRSMKLGTIFDCALDFYFSFSSAGAARTARSALLRARTAPLAAFSPLVPWSFSSSISWVFLSIWTLTSRWNGIVWASLLSMACDVCDSTAGEGSSIGVVLWPVQK